MISSISLLETTNVVVPDTNIFFWTHVSVADTAAVNPINIKTLLANDLSTSFIIGKPAFSNGPGSRTRNPPDLVILDNLAFDNFILSDGLFAKALWSFEACLSVSN